MDGFLWSKELYTEYRKLKRKVDGIKGPGVVNTPDGILIISPGVVPPPRQKSFPPLIYDAKITAKTAINGGIRYSYTIEIGHWDMTSSPSSGGTWVADFDGITSTAFNSAEDMNTFTSGTGAIGTGNTNVTQSDGTVNGGSCKLVPLPVGGYVTVKPRGTDSSGTAYYTIINFANSAQ